MRSGVRIQRNELFVYGVHRDRSLVLGFIHRGFRNFRIT